MKNEPLLFTPGPLTTSRTVREAMLRDVGSRDDEFVKIIDSIRMTTLRLAGLSPDEYSMIPIQGCGTFGLEAVLTTVIPADGKLLVCVNGEYSKRLPEIAGQLGVDVDTLIFDWLEIVDPAAVAEKLTHDQAITHVVCCHCETTMGIINPVAEIGAAAARAGVVFICDAISSFGAEPLDIAASAIDYLISSPNKCIEGVPGFSFVIAKKQALAQTGNNPRSVCLDLRAQYDEFERSGQFRFTPPTHAILAFAQALAELEEEGGIEGRYRRYSRNQKRLAAGMREMGFETLLAPEWQSSVLTVFASPADGMFEYGAFYAGLKDEGFVIYRNRPGVTENFRVGTMGRLTEDDVEAFLSAVKRITSRPG